MYERIGTRGREGREGGVRGTKRYLNSGHLPLEPVWFSMTYIITPFLSFLFFYFSPSIFPSFPPSLPLPFLHFSSSPVTEDYGALPTTILTFDSSTIQYTVPVDIVNDDRAEPTETFTGSLNLISPVSNRITVSPDQTTVSIEDDDREE